MLHCKSDIALASRFDYAAQFTRSMQPGTSCTAVSAPSVSSHVGFAAMPERPCRGIALCQSSLHAAILHTLFCKCSQLHDMDKTVRTLYVAVFSNFDLSTSHLSRGGEGPSGRVPGRGGGRASPGGCHWQHRPGAEAYIWPTGVCVQGSEWHWHGHPGLGR